MATAPKTPTSDRKAPTLVSSDPKRTAPVTADTFIRTDSNLYFGNIVKDGGHLRRRALYLHEGKNWNVLRLRGGPEVSRSEQPEGS